jgi:hypothetical protein
MSWLAGQKDEEDEHDNLGVDWVLQYEFGEIGKESLHISWPSH